MSESATWVDVDAGRVREANAGTLSDNLVMSNHAQARFAQRTPDTPVHPQAAFVDGEFVRFPVLSDANSEPAQNTDGPTAARVFIHRDGWGVVFVIDALDPDLYAPYADTETEFIVPTVHHVRGYHDGPVKAYFRAHGPHTPGGRE